MFAPQHKLASAAKTANPSMICNLPAGITPCNVRWQGSTRRQPGMTNTRRMLLVLNCFGRMILLELFSNTNSVSKISEQLGYEIVSMDFRNADIRTYILNWGYTTYQLQHFDVIWVSVFSDLFSCLFRFLFCEG